MLSAGRFPIGLEGKEAYWWWVRVLPPSRHANLAFTGVYKTPLHGWCYPPRRGIVLWDQSSSGIDCSKAGWAASWIFFSSQTSNSPSQNQL